MKRICLLYICLPVLLLAGCSGAGAPKDQSAEATPVLSASAEIYLIANTPEPTPVPTPEPTPTPAPKDYYGQRVRDNLLMDQQEIRLVAFSSGIELYDAPNKSADSITLLNRVTDRSRSELIVLSEVTSENDKLFYQVQSAFSEDTGYVLASDTRDSRLAANGVSGYAMMQCPGCSLMKSPDEESDVLSQESYHAVRILGDYRDYYYVRTQDGNFGYVLPGQLKSITTEELEEYLAAGVVPAGAEAFDMEDFIDYALNQAQASSTEELLVDALTRQGMFFLPGYYEFYQKDFQNREIYPHEYREDVYNSLLFKLWNSAGNLVYYEGNPTQWDYVPADARLERGDILFFSEYGAGDTAVVEKYEIVFRGRDSGYITACGLYLGDGRMLWVRNGTAEVLENLTNAAIWQYFDSARRIHTEVTDVKAHLIETMIASAYDRLGTPYNNFCRMGEDSFDCSGLVGWALRRAGVTQLRSRVKQFRETTASGLCHLETLYMGELTLEMQLVSKSSGEQEDIPLLERGDLVFLLGETQPRISHVMIYLGDLRVIHSTTVTDVYRGTLVAGFREELQGLYSNALRIAAID
jgi:cell wall-associated NlpC family hydrolase